MAGARPVLLVATRGWDPAPWVERTRAHLPDRLVLATDSDGVLADNAGPLEDIHYILAWKPRAETLARLPALRVIFSLGAGVDPILALPDLPDVPVVRIVDPGLTARMGEYVVWQVLDHLRSGPALRSAQAERRWADRDPPPAGAVTVGIMGLGELGRHAATTLRALGFAVQGWARTPRPDSDIPVFAGDAALDAFLAGTDILVALLPLTPATTGLINLALLRKLRRTGPLGGAILINAGRGGSQVEADIVAALAEGTLAGASLDVFATEPLPADSPLWTAPNLTITPHVAAVSDPAELVRQIAEQVETFERGGALRNGVDRARYY